VILSAQGLCHVGIKEGYKAKGPEGPGNEHISDFAKLGEILAQVVRVYVLGAAAHEHLARHLVAHAL